MPSSLIQQVKRYLVREPPPPTVFAFGKLPAYGDFISRNLEGAPWLGGFFESLAMHGRVGHADPWLDLDCHPQRVFLSWKPIVGRGSVALFAMVPSSDKHGRRFPFAMGWYGPKVEHATTWTPSSLIAELPVPASIEQLLEMNVTAMPEKAGPEYRIRTRLSAWRLVSPMPHLAADL